MSPHANRSKMNTKDIMGGPKGKRGSLMKLKLFDRSFLTLLGDEESTSSVEKAKKKRRNDRRFRLLEKVQMSEVEDEAFGVEDLMNFIRILSIFLRGSSRKNVSDFWTNFISKKVHGDNVEMMELLDGLIGDLEGDLEKINEAKRFVLRVVSLFNSKPKIFKQFLYSSGCIFVPSFVN